MGINKPISLEGQNIEVDLTGVNTKLETLTTELATVKSDLSTVGINVNTVKTNVSTIKTNTTAKSYKKSTITITHGGSSVKSATTKRVTLSNGKLVNVVLDATTGTSGTAYLKIVADGITIFENDGESISDTSLYFVRQFAFDFCTQNTAPHRALDIEFKSLEIYCDIKSSNNTATKTLVVDYIG